MTLLQVNREWREHFGLSRLALHCMELRIHGVLQAHGPGPEDGQGRETGEEATTLTVTCPLPHDLRSVISRLPLWDKAIQGEALLVAHQAASPAGMAPPALSTWGPDKGDAEKDSGITVTQAEVLVDQEEKLKESGAGDWSWRKRCRGGAATNAAVGGVADLRTRISAEDLLSSSDCPLTPEEVARYRNLEATLPAFQGPPSLSLQVAELQMHNSWDHRVLVSQDANPTLPSCLCFEPMAPIEISSCQNCLRAHGSFSIESKYEGKGRSQNSDPRQRGTLSGRERRREMHRAAVLVLVTGLECR